MINQKDHDWILNVLSNPSFSTSDFKDVGLSAENTSLLEEDIYKRSNKILENPLFKGSDGLFDNSKFHKFYQTAEYMYNMLSNETYLEKSAEEAVIYGKDDIFAPKKLRRTFEDTVLYSKLPNPDRLTTSLIRVGETTAPLYSDEEIAQTQKVLNNPIEAGKDPSKAEWHDSPNTSWFTDFWDTRVLAQWDEDGTHIDPITGLTVSHLKGQLKLNENGTYFYENLDGRDVYGRRVLNKMNTLTTDGSEWNKYDFFDSDGLEQKSIGGNIMKNLALVGTMFIPYVGPVVAGASVATQLVGLTGTLGKMLLGSESPTLSALEGWSKSVNRQTAKSAYAQQNTWCWENFISLIGDVAGQLKELRFLFEYAPALIKGNKVIGSNGVSKLKQEKLAEEFADQYKKKISSTLEALQKEGKVDITTLKLFLDALKFAAVEGKGKLDEFMKSYYKMGEILSKGYMTAITVGDTYGEAKYYGGATDLEATLLTLGYAALEAKLLNTDIGNWILPELKQSGIKNKKIIETITKNIPQEMREKVIDATNKEAKLNFVKYWFNKGKELAQNLSVTGKGLVGQAVSGGLGEGFEETAEELLADFSKSCFNLTQWLQGDDNRMSVWDNMLDRYSMSFIGGVVGGGLTAVGTSFKENNTDISYELAILELIYKSRNNELSDLYKTLDKVTIGNKYLQGEFDTTSNQIKFKPATEGSSNFDTDIKNVIRNQIQLIDNLVKAEGLKYTDNQFISMQTFNDIRLAHLANSPITSSYLLDFNTLSAKIINVRNQMNQIKDKDLKTLSETEQSVYNNLNRELLDLKLLRDKYINGEYAMDYIGKSLLSMSPVFSRYFTKAFFKDYVEVVEKKPFEEISESRLKDLRTEFDAWKATGFKDHVSTMAPLYLTMARNFGNYVTNYSNYYDKIRQNSTIASLLKSKAARNSKLSGILDANNLIITLDTDAWIKDLESYIQGEDAETLVSLIFNKGDSNTKSALKEAIDFGESLDPTSTTYELDKKAAQEKISNILVNNVLNNVEYYYEDFIKAGSINPEIKNALMFSLEGLLKYQESDMKNLNMLSSIGYLTSLVEDYSFNLIEIDKNTSISEIFDLIYDEGSPRPELNYLDNLTELLKLPKVETVLDIINLKNKIEERGKQIDRVYKAIKESTYTDTIQFIADFILTNSDSKLDIYKLLEAINGTFRDNKEDLTTANLQQFGEQIDEAIEIIGWLQGLTLGAQYDAKASFDNMMGYNQTMNEIAKEHHAKNWEPLFVINLDTANIINQDLEIVKNKLILAKNLRFINEGKKSALQDKVATNKRYIDFNRLVKWVVNIDDSWIGKDKLLLTLSEAKLLNANAETRKQLVLNLDLQLQLEQETVAIDVSLYEFFEANKEKIQLGELKNLFKKDFNFWSDNNQLLNENTEFLNDKNFFWYLATRAALNKAVFLNQFKEVINPKIAPLPTLEEAIYVNVASVLNSDMFESFKKAFILAALEEFDSSSDKENIIRKFRPNISKDNLEEIIKEGNVSNWRVIPFYNISLTEGIPGAGKSEAVNYYTMEVLKNIPEISKNIWYAHNNIKGAEKAIKKLNIAALAFNHNSLMKSIFSEYNTSRLEDSEGNKIYNLDEWIQTSEGLWQLKYKADSLSNPPSLIIIDEISHYDEADLLLLLDLHNKYGTHIITSGDFDQSSISSVVYNKAGEKFLEASSFRSKFILSPKLGVSMRTSNSQMDKTISDYQAWLLLDRNQLKTTSRNFYYYEGDIGLNGVKQIESSYEAIKENIEKLLKTLKDGEKIGFIYYNENSENYKNIIRDYGDKIEPFKGSAALGFEGLYYIIDATNIPNDKDLYTAITRSSLGVLVINKLMGINSIKETVTSISGFPEQDLIKYFNKRKEILEKLGLKEDPLKYSPPSHKILPTTIKSPVTSVVAYTPPKNIPWNGAVKEFYIDKVRYYTDGKIVAELIDDVTLKEIEPANPVYAEILKKFNDPTLETIPIDNEGTNPFENSDTLNTTISETPTKILDVQYGKLEFFRYLFHSHNTFELGVGEDANGNIKWFGNIERYKYRFDSVIGLLKLYHENDWFKNHNIDKYKEIIGNLRGLFFTVPDKTTLATNITYLLNPNIEEGGNGIKVSDIEFGLVSAPLVSIEKLKKGQTWGYKEESDHNIFAALDKSYEEQTVNGTADQSLNRKTITATISFTNGKRLAIPLFVLGNLETYTRNPQNSISAKLAELHKKNGDNYYGFIEDILKDPYLKNVPEIFNLATLFKFTTGGYFKIPDDTWTPAKNLKNWGVQITTEATSGGKFEFKGVSAPVSEFLELNPGMVFSKKIYTSLQPIEDSEGNRIEISHKGHPFILMSLNPKLKGDDEKMKEIYKNLLLDPSLPKTVTLVYITPPKVSMETYIDNLYKIIKEKDPIKRKSIKLLGNHLTSYYNWEALLPALKNENSKIYNKLTKDAREFIVKKIEELLGHLDKLSILLSEETWPPLIFGQPQTLSVLNHLNYLFLSMFTNFGGDEEINEEAKKEVLEALLEVNRDSIYYSPRFLNKIPENNQEFIPILLDVDSSYTINGLPFTINAKIDSSLFSLDNEFNNIISGWVSKIKKNNNTKLDYSEDTSEYLHLRRLANKDIKKYITENGTELTFEKLKDGTITINGKTTNIPWDEIDNKVKSLSRESNTRYLLLLIGGNELEPIVDKVIELSIEDLLNNTNKSKEFINNQVLDFIRNTNKNQNNLLTYLKSGKVIRLKFAQSDLDKMGGYISVVENITSALSSNFQEIRLNDEALLKIDFTNDTAIIEITEESKEISNIDYDNVYYEEGADLNENLQTIKDSLTSIDESKGEDIFNDSLLGELLDVDGNLLALKNRMDIINTLEDFIKNVKEKSKEVSEILNLINYLKDENTLNFCTITIKSLK